MKRTVAMVTTILAIGYFGYVRQSEAHCLRMRAKPTCWATPIVCSTPCAVDLAVVTPSAPAAKPPSAEPPKAPPKPIVPPTSPPTPKPKPIGKLYGVLIIDDANADSGPANNRGRCAGAKDAGVERPTAGSARLRL